MPGLSRQLLALGDELLATLFHPICLHCNRFCGAGSLCESCRGWEVANGLGCDQCGSDLPQAMLRCGRCLKRPKPWVRARSLLRLTEPIRSVVHQIKYAHWRELLHLFDEPIEQYFEAFFPLPIVSVPIPLHSGRLVDRGFNQAEDIARKLRLPLETGRLTKVAATEPQSTLSEPERRKNLKGVFEWEGEAPERVLLVDDVYTTGNTMAEAARTLKRAGVKEIYVWTLFRA